MKKRLISMLLALLAVMGLLPTAAFAASTPEEALGEVQIYNGGVEMSYLSINGRIRSQIYTYYNYDNGSGSTREIPAYCVNPNTLGVPQTVGVGESIEYLADEKASDPKVVGIVANGYPTRSLAELGLENKYQGYYATKMALWCYLLSNWDINNLKVNPNLTGVELQRAQKILAAAKDVYARGTAWNEMLSPEVTCTPDRDTAYEVTIDGKQYKQQVFTFWSKTWVCDYSVNVAFSVPDDVPDGTRIVDMNNQDITTITTEGTGDGYAGKFKILYPLESVQGKTGSVQLSFNTNVYKYAVFFAICQEKDEYGELQNYVVDTDPTTVANNSNVPLENFYLHDRFPTDCATAKTITTGTYNTRLNYQITYKTNYNDYRVLATNLLSTNNYAFDLSAISLMQDEVVTDVRLEFGKVPAGFASVVKPTVTIQTSANLANGYQVVNRADAGGQYMSQWETGRAA